MPEIRHPAGNTHRGSVVSDDELAEHAADEELHGGGAHPDLAAHNTLGLATQTALDTHAGTPHAGDHPDEDHDFAAVTHTHDFDGGAPDSVFDPAVDVHIDGGGP